MQYQETEQKNIRGIGIVKDAQRAFHCIFSIDTHAQGHTAHTEALEFIYTKALLSGCNGYTREAFLDAINLLGASISIDLQDGVLSISCTSLDTHRQKVLTLVRAMLAEPTFAAQELTRIKQLVGNELHELKEDAKSHSVVLFANALYGQSDRRFSSPLDAIIKELKTITRKELLSFHKHALSNKWTYTLVCDTATKKKTEDFLGSMRNLFGDTAEHVVPHEPKVVKKGEVILHSIPSKQNIELSIGGALPLHVNSKEYYAFNFGLQVLGKWGGFAGRLMSTVREKEGLTYGIYARTESVSLAEYGYWRIMTFFAPDKVVQGITSTLREINLIRDKGITQTEYDRFMTILKTSRTLLQDSVVKTAADLHAYQLKGYTLAEIEEHKKALGSVTRSEVNAALKKYLDPSKLIIAGAGPVDQKKKELYAFRSLAQSKK